MAENEYSCDNFLKHHKTQLVLSGIPSIFWPKLYEKLKNESFDAGEHFSMIYQNDGDGSDKSDDDDDDENIEVNQTSNICGESVKKSGYQRSKWKVLVCNQHGISPTDPSKIFLVDHAWTFNPKDARQQLFHVPGLMDRMHRLVCHSDDSTINSNSISSRTKMVDKILSHLWLYTQTYTVNRDDLELEETLSVWYIMDEFGSRIRHNDNPKFRLVPFYFVPQNMLYSALFPVVDCAYGDEVTRDFVEGTMFHRPEWRDYYLLPWFPKSFAQLPINFNLPGDEYFQSYEPTKLDVTLIPTHCSRPVIEKLKVFAEDNQFVRHLNHPRFEIVEDVNQADVWWLHSHFKDFNFLMTEKPMVMINQFPYEAALTVKDLLAACVHLAYKAFFVDEKTMNFQPPWFCTTFNLRTELPQFVSYFQQRKLRNLDNTWIVKPWNLARSLDTFVTDDIKEIIRLIDSGPKIACKYVEDPVLFHRPDKDAWVKFDMRFIALLKSVESRKLYVYNKFWLRFAQKQFSLNEFDDFEKHFTVFNYSDSDKILQMHCEDFVTKLCSQYPDCDWPEVLKSIYRAIYETFQVVTFHEPPRGLANFRQSRAMYGVDVMLKWCNDSDSDSKRGKFMQPVILEVNFIPDCKRACEYYPDFANTVFETLFIDHEPTNLPVVLLAA